MTDHDKRDDRATETGDTDRERASEQREGQSPTDDDLARNAMNRPGAAPRSRPKLSAEDKRLIGVPAALVIGAVVILLLILFIAF